jgi:antibiotic biosynthesis monooxygenase (ABM) superfamily enzyme
MIKHIVLWKLKDQAEGAGKAANAVEVKQKLEALNGHIPGMIKLEVGIDISHTGASFDVVLYSEFDTRAALEAYHHHPLHQAVSPFIGAVREQRILVDYEI